METQNKNSCMFLEQFFLSFVSDFCVFVSCEEAVEESCDGWLPLISGMDFLIY